MKLVPAETVQFFTGSTGWHRHRLSLKVIRFGGLHRQRHAGTSTVAGGKKRRKLLRRQAHFRLPQKKRRTMEKCLYILVIILKTLQETLKNQDKLLKF